MSKASSIITTKYKRLLIIPVILLIASLAIIFTNLSSHGYIVNRDVSLAGGTSATLSTSEYNVDEIMSILQENFPNSEISIRELSDLTSSEKTGVIIDVTEVTAKELRPILEENIVFDDISIQEVGSTLGASFFKEMVGAIIFAFILMAITILIIFRKLVPSFAVVFSAFLDLVVTLAIISLLDIKLSSAGIAAFLMLIGYSVDTDVMLTTRLLKRMDGTLEEKVSGAIKTGLTMTLTTIAALTVGFIVTNSPIIKQMFGIILIGLVVDIISTWVMNSSLLVWYIKKNERSA